MPRRSSLYPLARFTWLLLAGLALVVQIIYLRAGLERIYYDPRLASSFPPLRHLFTYETYVLAALFWRSLITYTCWLAAVFIFWQVGRREGEYVRIARFSALLLALLPQLLFFSGYETETGLAPPWEAIHTAAGQFLTFLALVMLVLFYYLFPDGRLASTWMRRAAWFFAIGLSALSILILIGSVDTEWFWFASLFIVLAAFMVAVAIQIYRYYHQSDPSLRHQVKWVTFSLALLPLGLFAPWFLWGATRSVQVGTLVSAIIPILLPLSMLAALAGRGMWQFHFSAHKRRGLILWSSALAIMFISPLLLALRLETAKTSQLLVFEPIPSGETPRPVIIDTDMAPDDWIAILYLLQRPNVQVLAITVTGTGEAHCQPGVRNALRLVALSGESQIPVACGRETPLQGEQEFPSAWREQSDSLAGLQLPDGMNPAPNSTATDLLHSVPFNTPENITLVTLGPLTNLAEAIQEDAAFLDKVEQIYIMGGALEVLGNVGLSGVGIDNQVAEWNIFVDPLALQIVLASGAPITLVPLDATNQVPARLEFFRHLEANRRTPEARFTYDVLATQLDFVASGGYSFWDPLTASIYVDESLGYIKEGQMKVYIQPGPSSGLTRLMPGGFPVHYVKSVNASRFEAELLRTLNQP